MKKTPIDTVERLAFIKRALLQADAESMEKALKWSIQNLQGVKLPDPSKEDIAFLIQGIVSISSERVMLQALLYGLGLIRICKSREQPEPDLTQTSLFRFQAGSDEPSKQD